jgi:hypothetical protein
MTVPDAGESQNGFMATQKYYYDSLNRIDDAIESIGGNHTWRQDFSYDRNGNRNFYETNTTMPASFAYPPTTNPTISGTTSATTSTGGEFGDASFSVKIFDTDVIISQRSRL